MYDRIEEIEIETDRGDEAARQGRLDIADIHYNKALTLAEYLTDDRIRQQQLRKLSVLFAEQNLPDLTLMAAHDAVELDRKLGSKSSLLSDLITLGVAHFDLANDFAAERALSEAAKLGLELEDWKDAAAASCNLGNVYAKWRLYAQAIDMYERSLHCTLNTSDAPAEVNTRLMLLQTAELSNYDPVRTIENAMQICTKYWKDLEPVRDQIRPLISSAIARYLLTKPELNANLWKRTNFPML